jgi:hypothetical protein
VDAVAGDTVELHGLVRDERAGDELERLLEGFGQFGVGLS